MRADEEKVFATAKAGPEQGTAGIHTAMSVLRCIQWTHIKNITMQVSFTTTRDR